MQLGWCNWVKKQFISPVTGEWIIEGKLSKKRVEETGIQFLSLSLSALEDTIFKCLWVSHSASTCDYQFRCPRKSRVEIEFWRKCYFLFLFATHFTSEYTGPLDECVSCVNALLPKKWFLSLWPIKLLRELGNFSKGQSDKWSQRLNHSVPIMPVVI